MDCDIHHLVRPDWRSRPVRRPNDPLGRLRLGIFGRLPQLPSHQLLVGIRMVFYRVGLLLQLPSQDAQLEDILPHLLWHLHPYHLDYGYWRLSGQRGH